MIDWIHTGMMDMFRVRVISAARGGKHGDEGGSCVSFRLCLEREPLSVMGWVVVGAGRIVDGRRRRAE